MTRKLIFEVGKKYHIYNRGVDKRKIFIDKGDLYYFFDSMILSNNLENFSNRGGSKNTRKLNKTKIDSNKKIVKIIAYSLLPNHYHFILEEIVEGGISRFMQKLGNSYARYFNEKHNRSGTLFQGRYKASLLAYENSLDRTSAYVNLNYKHHGYDLKKDLIKTSIFEYLGEEKGEKICDQKEIEKIIKESGGLEKYKKNIQNWSKIFVQEHNKNDNELDFVELEF